MSSEVCPHCGKTYKRLKSHLPHCKAAASSKTPGTTQDVPPSQTSRSTAALSKTTRGQKVKQTSSLTLDLQEAEEVKKVAAPLSSPSFSTTLPPSSVKKKKKQKVADQIKTTAVFSSPSPPPSPTFSKPKKKSLRALIEAAKLEHFTKESLKETKESSFNGCSSDQKGTKVYPEKDSVKDQRPTIKNVILDSSVKDNTTKLHSGHSFCVESQVETEESLTQRLFLKSGSGHQVKVTLQDVKATLGRANTHRYSGRPSILSRIGAAADNQSSQIQCETDFSSVQMENRKDGVGLVAPRSDKLLRSDEQQHTELQLFHRESKQPALIPPQQDATCQQEPGSPAAFVLTASASQVQQATPTPGKLSPTQLTRLPSVLSPVSLFSGFLLASAAAQSLPEEVRKPSAAEKPAEGPLTQQSLGQVRLKELPTWLASRTPKHPRDVVDMVQSGWRWYYRRYIDVKKGGVAGVSMLLAGYCVLSYIWSYPHIKLSRWRKYH